MFWYRDVYVNQCLIKVAQVWGKTVTIYKFLLI